MKERKSGRRSAPRYSDFQRWVGLPHFLLKSPAWVGVIESAPGGSSRRVCDGLSPNAKALLIAVWQRYDGRNNGGISFSVREAEAIGLHKNTASRTFDELAARGFLAVARNSGFTLKTREARLWRITALPTGNERATNDFLRWRPAPPITVPPQGPSEIKIRSLYRDAQSLHRDREGVCATNGKPTVPVQGPSEPETPPSHSLHRDTYRLARGSARNNAPGAWCRDASDVALALRVGVAWLSATQQAIALGLDATVLAPSCPS